MPMKNELPLLYDLAVSNKNIRLEASSRRMGVIERWRVNREVDALDKAVSRRLSEIDQKNVTADEQHAVVNDALELFGMYDNYNGVQEKTSVTFKALENLSENCEPLIAIIETLIRQVASFAQQSESTMGFVDNPGIQVVMTDREATPTREDRKKMKELEQFILECGFCEPPEDEKPVNYQPGFEPFIKQFVRDSLTYDWACVRKWKSSKDPRKFPVTCFAAIDSACIRRVKRKVTGVERGDRVTEAWDGDARFNKGEKKFVEVIDGTSGTQIISEYTADQISAFVRNPRTGRRANGYGYSEIERALNAITGWVWGRDYNMSRFRNDSLPRGILTILGQINEPQFQAFKLEWKQMLQGLSKRWFIPTVRGLGGDGKSTVQYTALDASSRDQEYHQWMFSVSLWLHSIYGVHPEQTGYEALSPFRPPLSEASPETKIKYAQETALDPILRGIASFLNRHILWPMYPDRRYAVRFVGMGDQNQMQQVEVWTSELNANITTPRIIWAKRDMVIPEALADSPAWDIPAPFMTGLQYLDMKQQAEAAEQQQAQQMQFEQSQAQQQQQHQSMAPAPQNGSPAPNQPPAGVSPQDQSSQPQNPYGAFAGVDVEKAVRHHVFHHKHHSGKKYLVFLRRGKKKWTYVTRHHS